MTTTPLTKRCIITPTANQPYWAIPHVFAFDCVVNEKHDEQNQITQFPVEDNGNISDHIRRQPQKLQLEGIVAESSMFSDTDEIFPNQSDRIQRALEVIEMMLDSQSVFDVSTSLKKYESMAIENTSISRDKVTGRIISLSVTFQKVLKSTTVNVKAPNPKTPRASSSKKSGKAVGTEEDPKVKDKASYLTRILESAESELKANNALEFQSKLQTSKVR